MITEIINLHKFFVRKSQHYLNGDWSCYTPFTLDQIAHYPVAYTKFLYWGIRDILNKK